MFKISMVPLIKILYYLSENLDKYIYIYIYKYNTVNISLIFIKIQPLKIKQSK